MIWSTKSLLFFFKKINLALEVKWVIYAPLVSKQKCKNNDRFQTGFPKPSPVCHWLAIGQPNRLPRPKLTPLVQTNNVLIVPQCLHCMGELIYDCITYICRCILNRGRTM